MRIIIAGAGKLGFSIAQLLAEDQFDVVVVELDPKRKEVVQNALDVLAIEGNSCSPTVFADPDVRGADVLIACTDGDEVNMVTCLMAKNYGIKHTVARIRNIDYAVHAPEMLHRDMKIDLVINPERITAVEINNILMTPSALNVDEFAEGKVRMFEAKIREDSPFINIPLKDLEIPKDILMAMVFRRHRMIIPRGNDYILPGDNVYFVGKYEAIREFESSFSNTFAKLEKVLIIGAGRTGRFLAPMLEDQGIQVKVIEKNKERCQMLAAKLQKGLVLCGDGTDIDLLLEEGIAEADVVICLTEDDKLNLLLAQLAKHLGAPKTIVRVTRNEYIELMEKVGVDIVLSSRLLSAGEVLRFVRKGGIVSVSLLEGAQAEALEIIVGKDSDADGAMLRDIKLPKECLLCAIVRNNEAYIPNGNTVLHANDRIILFIKSELSKNTVPIFEGRG
ncbi:Trk system potassium transporter TrkA [uncultured Phascolarctobacterium sp.]|uniref:Trk system potassium transporter TrkA n=1 Tax=uncultured Phascolarctobacterium sp. TaxID=512296 RepID=UPI0026261B7F|nr:Trk system potassium transporter TrkA [uncultured Phascolarctobacterium sp.]